MIFWGDVVREGPEGLDFSRCEFKCIPSDGMEHMGLADVRKTVRRYFDRATARKKLVIEVATCRSDLVAFLFKIKSDADWAAFMHFVSTPGSPMYGRAMMYVQWIDTPRSLSYAGEGSSSGVQGGYNGADPMEIVPTGVGEDVVQQDQELDVPENPALNKYFMARFDSYEILRIEEDLLG